MIRYLIDSGEVKFSFQGRTIRQIDDLIEEYKRDKHLITGRGLQLDHQIIVGQGIKASGKTNQYCEFGKFVLNVNKLNKKY